MHTSRRQALAGLAATATGLALGGTAHAASRRKPNFVVILCDDLGLGDVGQGDGGLIATPNIDRLAAGGVTLTDFYAAANLCTPSRAGLLTGRYPIRTGLAQNVIMQNDSRGLPLEEVTIAEALGDDYATALIGKWHLGHVAPFWPPTRHGFDLFFGLPYSHDMLPLSLYEATPGVELTQEDVDYPALQQRFVDRAERFISDNSSRPFFLTLAISAPHLPNYPSADHLGHSDAGLYGDTVEEIDALVGRLVALLGKLAIEQDTVVIFTSDNGPWFEGSPGGLRQRKGGGAYDGGYRVPFIASQPGTLPAGLKTDALASGIDLLPTLCAMAGVPLPAGRKIDGFDLSAVLQGARSPREVLYLFDNDDIVGLRTQQWKYIIADYYRGGMLGIDNLGYPQLYDIGRDPAENYSVAARHLDVLDRMKALLAQGQAEFDPLRHGPSGIRRLDREVVWPAPLRHH